MAFLKSKIIKKEDINNLLSIWKFLDKKIVFTNGCFDILHKGHIDYLAKASDLGDVLIIGLNSDKSIKKIKGDKRPIQDELSRSLIMASLHYVDYIILFDEVTPYEVIKFIKPDILVKGSDYNPEDIVGADIISANGGEIITIEFVEGYSTSNIINKISD